MYAFEQAVDLTHELANGMPIYPGDPSPLFEQASTIEKNGVNLTRMTLGSHTGTHMDAPHHFIEKGIGIDRIPVGQFFCEAVVLNLTHVPIGVGITRKDLEKLLEGIVKEEDAVLCYTGCSDLWGAPEVNSNFTFLTGDGAEYLVSKKIRAFGIDTLSVEKFHSKVFEAHKELLSHNIYIIESLNSKLKQFVGQRILLISLPIKLKGGDGAPCRSIAIPIKK